MRVICLSFVALVLVAGRSNAADEFPKGTFALKVGATDWTITFDEKGKYTVSTDGSERSTGIYKATKDEIKVTDTPPPGFVGDKSLTATGTYKWKLDGKKITFTLVKDDNKARVDIATAGPWEKKE